MKCNGNAWSREHGRELKNLSLGPLKYPRFWIILKERGNHARE